MDANLHLHSRYSDGSLWPERIVELAAKKGLGVIALTDHDTLGGTQEFAQAAAARGIRTIPACEIDCVAPEIAYRSELLAYFPGGSYRSTALLLGSVGRARAERLARFVEAARTLFGRPDLRFEDLVARKLEGRGPSAALLEAVSFNKVDFFSYLKAKALIAGSMSYPEFGKEYFKAGAIAESTFLKPQVEEVVAAVKADSGFVVLPHPGHQFGDNPERMRREKRRVADLFSWFRKRGVEGVELYWYRGGTAAAINALVRELASNFGFFFTHGSDCHGPGTEKFNIGEYSGEFAGFPGYPLAAP